MKRQTKFLTMLALLLTTATGAWADTVDLSTLAADYTATDGQVLTGSTSFQVTIASGATVTLSGVTITADRPMLCNGDAIIILADGTTNTLTASVGVGLQAYHQKTLTIRGTGTLNAKGAIYSPGIGNNNYKEIIIEGGTINAQGASNAAGIGLGYQNNGGNITITGGIVNATGGSNAPGIGSGAGRDHDGTNTPSVCGNITISGGNVTATAGGNCPNSIGAGNTGGTCGIITIGGTVFSGSISQSPLTYPFPAVTLDDTENNSTTLSTYNGKVADVTLSGRTLYKDGSWNTLCLPFDLTISGSVLDKATAETLESTSLADGTLTLNFGEAVSKLEAGKPYIIKWTTTGDNLASPVFEGVTISATTANVSTTYADFVGSFSPVSISGEDKTMLYLGADNTLYYPNAETAIGSCRAYFKLKDITAGDKANAVRAFSLNFGDGETTGITEIVNSKSSNSKCDAVWYTLDGRRLAGKPAVRGIYVSNGRKVVIK